MIRRTNIESAAGTDVGLVRQLNEDNYLVHQDVGLWVVADGMGGHSAGEVASGLIIDTLRQVDGLSSGYAFLDDVRDRLLRVNRTLLARAAIMAPGSVVGSTVAALMIYEGHFACLWAGDSRIYRLRDGILEQITRDHSMLQELLDAGSLQRADARNFKKSNIITRAIGVEEFLTLDMRQGPVEVGDLFLLCSDGLHGMLLDSEIRNSIVAAATLDAAVKDLIERTLERGASDNVTVVLVRATPDPEDTLTQTVVASW